MFVKVELFLKKCNHIKDQKIHSQGLENGCIRCLSKYTTTSLYNDTTIENIHISKELKNRILHLLLLQALEGANCGNLDEMLRIL